MDASELKEIRKATKKYIDHADERVVRMVYAMLQADAEYCRQEEYVLTPGQKAILEEQINAYKKGQLKFSSWEDVKARITAKK
jgi:hypothetical protein